MTNNTFARMLSTITSIVFILYLFISPQSVDLLVVPIWISISTLLVTTIIDLVNL